MAALLADPDDSALNIRAAISVASGDMFLIDPNDTSSWA
jgi:hypothetical protein